MDKNEIKRWMPMAVFTMVTNTLIIDSGVGLNIFQIRENIFPLNEMISYNYGLLPVGTIWIFKYTYRKFWLCSIVEIIFSLVFIRLLHPFLHNRGILVWTNPESIGGIGAFTVTIIHYLIIYIYQMWQGKIFSFSNKNNS